MPRLHLWNALDNGLSLRGRRKICNGTATERASVPNSPESLYSERHLCPMHHGLTVQKFQHARLDRRRLIVPQHDCPDGPRGGCVVANSRPKNFPATTSGSAGLGRAAGCSQSENVAGFPSCRACFDF
jgi:hypothetical protein